VSKDFGSISRRERYQADVFFADLTGRRRQGRRRRQAPAAETYAEQRPLSLCPLSEREWELVIAKLLEIMGQDRLLQGNPLLERSVKHRFPYLDPLNHVQVELLKQHRAQADPDERVLRGIQLTINGVSAGLRNTG